ncbi:MAG TPA: hypothetical protein VM823_01785, partial [Gaiellales bacterium]|nr:hypothetical protein [Gaiellales bacterium]
MQLPTELALVGVSLATLVGFRRLFLDWSFLGKPLLLVLLSHLLAGLLRRRRTPVALAALISAVVLVVVGGWLFYASTTRLGLPGSATLDAFTTAEISAARATGVRRRRSSPARRWDSRTSSSGLPRNDQSR